MGSQILAPTYSPDGRGQGSDMVVIARRAIETLDEGLYKSEVDIDKMLEQAELLKVYAGSLHATLRKLKKIREA